MPRPPKPEAERRSESLTVRLTKAEKQLVDDVAGHRNGSNWARTYLLPALHGTDLATENEQLRRHAERLAASLLAVLRDAHPTFPSTAKWHGGLGGSAITSHCSLTQGAAPGTEWAEYGLHEEPLRDFLREHPDFDITATKNDLITEWNKHLPARPEIH